MIVCSLFELTCIKLNELVFVFCFTMSRAPLNRSEWITLAWCKVIKIQSLHKELSISSAIPALIDGKGSCWCGSNFKQGLIEYLREQQPACSRWRRNKGVLYYTWLQTNRHSTPVLKRNLTGKLYRFWTYWHEYNLPDRILLYVFLHEPAAGVQLLLIVAATCRWTPLLIH